MMVKYSFIVPMYNVENYIQDCVNSILKQDFGSFEIILVNDGSTDSTEGKCKLYRDEKNVRYYYKDNGGLSDARNFGIKHSSGEYLIFIDSDDFYGEIFLKKLDQIVIAYNPDIIILNNNKYYEDKNKHCPTHPIKAVSGLCNLLRKGIFKACAWDKVVKRKWLIDNDLYFSYGLLSEDILWCGQLLKCNPKIIYYEIPVYEYRQRSGSISKTVSSKHIDDIFNMISALIENDSSNEISEFVAFEYASLLLNISMLDNQCRKSKKESYKKFDYVLKKSVSHKALFVSCVYGLFGYNISCCVLRLIQSARMRIG